MPSAFSNRMAATATRLLKQYGSTAVLVKAGSKAWDPVALDFVVQPSTRVALTGAPVPVAAGLVNGTTIQAGDMTVKCDGSVKPAMADKVEFDGAVWSVVNISPKMVNDQVIAYFIQVRK